MSLHIPALKNKTTLFIVRVLALLVVIAISIFIFSIRDRAEELAFLGYPGIFLLAFLSYATVLLPAPGVAIVFTMGGVFNPVGVALAAGAGAALGELSGYLAGFSGQGVVENKTVYLRLYKWMVNNGRLAVFLLSAVPNPFFDIAGMAAGILKMPVQRFLLFCWLGETCKMFIFAFAGASSIPFLAP